MKKMKKMLALALAFVLAVTILPMVGSEQAKAEEVTGFYRWYYKDNNAEGGIWEEVIASDFKVSENPVVINNPKYIGLTDYADKISVTCHGKTFSSYKRFYRVTTKLSLTITAPFDGTIEFYCLPRQNATVEQKLIVNDVECENVIPVPVKNTEKKVTNCDLIVNKINVNKGNVYEIKGNNEIALVQINFIPATKSVVSTMGAAYREAGGSWGNGVRFGAELDKTSADNIEESGTLVARQDAVGDGTELKVDTEKCKKVVRTTVWKETDNVLQYTLVVTNIPEGNEDTVLVARPYVKLKNGTYIYGEQISGSWNSVKAEVASGN